MADGKDATCPRARLDCVASVSKVATTSKAGVYWRPASTAPTGVTKPRKVCRSKNAPPRLTPTVPPKLAATAATAGCNCAGSPSNAACEKRSGSCEPEMGRLLSTPVSSSRRFSNVNKAR